MASLTGKVKSLLKAKSNKPPFTKIRKRDGQIAKYNKQRIIDAVYRALIVSNKKTAQENLKLAKKVADKVEEKLFEVYKDLNRYPQVEEIQDLVEATLLEENLFKALKRYVNYRQVRRFIREEKKAVLNKDRLDPLEKKMSLTAIQILEARYLIKDKEGKVVESISHLFKRSAIAAVLSDLVLDEKVVDRNQLYSMSHGIKHDFESAKAKVNDLDFKVYDNEVKAFLETIKSKLAIVPNRIEDMHSGYSIGQYPLMYGHLERMAMLYDEIKHLYPKAIKVNFNKFLDLLSSGYFDKYEKQITTFYKLLTSREFVPNSPTLMNAGHRLGQLSACFVLDIEDDLKHILLTAAHVGIIFQSGGGVGMNYGKLRPKGDIVASTNGIASGPLSFMRIIETVTDVVKQGGRRRGANMGVLDVFHPDIEDFITVKEDLKRFTNFNLSVGFWESFFDALKEKRPYGLINPRTKEIVKTIDPDYLIDRVAQGAWKSAEPGCLFFDNMNKYNVLLKAKGYIRATNPCGEQPLYSYESCNLGSVDVAKCVVKKDNKYIFDWKKYHNIIRKATRFLDGIVDINNYPLPMVRYTTRASRKIGLGAMGVADALFKLGIPYNSKQAYELMERWAEDLTYYSMLESVELAKEKSAFSYFKDTDYLQGKLPIAGFYDDRPKYRNWKKLADEIKQYGIRNAMTTTLAPTGSISMIADTSSGLEPQFALVYKKNVAIGSFFVIDQAFQEYLTFEKRGDEKLKDLVADNYGRLQGLDDYFTKEEQRRFITAQEIHWIDHIFAQFVWQRWISASISKTINMPNHVTPSDIKHAYLLGHELGLKGLTIFRDGSRSGVIEISGKRRKDTTKPTKYVVDYIHKGILSANTIYGVREDYKQGLLEILADVDDQDVISPREADLSANYGLTNQAGDDKSMHEHNLGDVETVQKINLVDEDIADLRTNNDLNNDSVKQGQRGGIVKNKSDKDTVSKVNNSPVVQTKSPGVAGSKQKSSLTNYEKGADVDNSQPQGEVCPVCGSTRIVHESGCEKCLDCGWSACSVS